MKLIRFGPSGHEKPGVILADDRRIDVSAAFPNFDEAFFATDGLTRLSAWLERNSSTAPEVSGDVISTDTLADVGLGFKPPQYIQPGDVIELGIDRLGTQRQVAKPCSSY